MRDIENHMTVDEIWDKPKEKICADCGYPKSLCECPVERE